VQSTAEEPIPFARRAGSWELAASATEVLLTLHGPRQGAVRTGLGTVYTDDGSIQLRAPLPSSNGITHVAFTIHGNNFGPSFVTLWTAPPGGPWGPRAANGELLAIAESDAPLEIHGGEASGERAFAPRAFVACLSATELTALLSDEH